MTLTREAVRSQVLQFPSCATVSDMISTLFFPHNKANGKCDQQISVECESHIYIIG